jgi:hypothetical protein
LIGGAGGDVLTHDVDFLLALKQYAEESSIHPPPMKMFLDRLGALGSKYEG